MPTKFDRAILSVQLLSDHHSMTDISLLVEAMQNMVIASVWSAMVDPEPKDDAIVRARSILMESTNRSKASSRFYPGFTVDELFSPIPGLNSASNDRRDIRRRERDIRRREFNNFDPYDPLDVGVRIGMDSWFRRTLYSRDRELYQQLFSFGHVQRLEHHSPLLIELVAVLGFGVTVPVVLVYGLMSAVHRARRIAAEADIRETDADLKKEELKQQRLKTRILEDIADGVGEMRERHHLEIPKEVLVQVATLGAPSVADLGDSPLIGEVSIGLSAGYGKK